MVGHGGEYTLSTVDDYRHGCEFTVTTIDENADSMEWALPRLVGASSLPIPVYMNGRLLTTSELPSRANRVLRDADGNPWGKEYLTTDSCGQLSVSVGGLVMYSTWVSGRNDVRVELTPARARQVLVASRDNLRDPFNQQLDQFISDLSMNRLAAMDTQERLDVHVASGGFMKTLAPRPDDTNYQPTVDSSAPVARGVTTDVPASALTHVHISPAPARYMPNHYLVATPELESPAVEHGVGCDVYLFADTVSGRVNRLARQWDPRRWGTGGTRRKVLLAWKTAVTYCLRELVSWRPDLGNIDWTIGVVFNEASRAAHLLVGDAHVLALNPVGDDGTIAFKLTDRASRRDMLSLAVHEACHVVISNHDEEFAALLTGLYGRIDQTDADRVIRTAF